MNDLPQLQMLCLNKSKHLSPVLQRVALWLAENLPVVGWCGVEELARDIGTSPASVIRCTQQLGFSGYLEFQQTVRKLLPPSGLAWRVARRVSHGTSDLDMLIDNEIAHLETMRTLSVDIVGTLVAHFQEAQKVLVTANLMSVAMGQYLADHWNLLNGNIAFMDSGTVQCAVEVSNLHEDDLLIALAFPRYSTSTLDLLKVCQSSRVPSILLTDETGPLEVHGATVINLPVLSQLYFPSATALVLLTQVVAYGLLTADMERSVQHLNHVEQVWDTLHLFGQSSS